MIVNHASNIYISKYLDSPAFTDNLLLCLIFDLLNQTVCILGGDCDGSAIQQRSGSDSDPKVEHIYTQPD